MNVQPKRLDIVTVQERQTLGEFNRRLPSAVPIEELAIINELAGPAAPIAAGSLVKRVVGSNAPPQLSAGRR